MVPFTKDIRTKDGSLLMFMCRKLSEFWYDTENIRQAGVSGLNNTGGR